MIPNVKPDSSPPSKLKLPSSDPVSHHHANRPEWQKVKDDAANEPFDERRVLRKA
jgi:hypothetical protein